MNYTYAFQPSVFPVIEANDTCIVTWDGTEYECVASFEKSYSCVLGDRSGATYPFYLYLNYDELFVYAEAASPGTHTIGIETMKHDKINWRYLSPVYQGVEKQSIIDALNAISRALNVGLTFTDHPVSIIENSYALKTEDNSSLLTESGQEIEIDFPVLIDNGPAIAIK